MSPIKSNLQFQIEPNGGLSVYKPGYYCGPGWGFTKQDIVSGRIKQLPGAYDAIDNACKNHDQCYADNGYFSLSCDFRLVGNLAEIVTSPNSSSQKRLDAAVMAAYFAIEIQVDPKLRTVVDIYHLLLPGIRTMANAGVRFDRIIAEGVSRLRNATNGFSYGKH